MKQLISLLLLLLALCTVFTSCTSTVTPADTNESESESVTEQEKTPTEIYGIWYSRTQQSVLALTDLSKAAHYLLKIGYYKYESAEVGVATLEDNLLSFPLKNGETISLRFDPMTDLLTVDDSDVVYRRTTILPTEYLAIPFPDFTTIDAKSYVQLGNLTGLSLPTTEAELAEAGDAFSIIFGGAHPSAIPSFNDRPAQENDFVNIDYKGYLNGKAFEGGEATGAMLHLSENSGYIPGFAEGVLGHRVGETFEVTVTFPSSYHEPSLAGKETVFVMTLNAICDVRGAYLWQQASKNITVENHPEESYAYFVQYYEDVYHMYSYYYAMDYDTLLGMYDITDETILADAKENASNYLSIFAVIQTYGLSLDATMETMIDAMAKEQAETDKLSYEAAREQICESSLPAIYAQSACTVVMNWLVESNTAN